MLRLFGAPSPRTLAAYAEVQPLAAGHEARVPLWQLLPLLVHAVLFGGGYGAAAVPRGRAALRHDARHGAGHRGAHGGGDGRARAASAPRSPTQLEAEGARVVARRPLGGASTSPRPTRAERIAELAGGPVDILVNNAGTSEIKPLDELVDADWYAAFELNVMAPMRLMRHFAPGMAERGWGRIVNVTSTRGQAAVADLAGLLRGQGGAALALARVRRLLGAARRARQRGRARADGHAALARPGRARRAGRRARGDHGGGGDRAPGHEGAARPLRRAGRGRRR